ncbi:hypothetical protein ACF0H5_012839 [Mactra antiquata]
MKMNSTENSSFMDTDIYSKFRVAAPDLVIVDRVFTPIWYIIGIIGNTVSAKIWLSKHMRKSNSSAIYLGSIAIADLIFIFIHFWLELQGAWGISTYNKPILCELFNVVLYVPQYLTPLLILAFTFERFIAICFPFLKETFCSVKKAVIGVCLLTTCSCLLGLVQAIFWTYHSGMCISKEQESLVRFYTIWTWITEMLIFAVVPLIVLVLNVLVIREINRINKFQSSLGQDGSRSSNQTSTITLLSVSFYLICTLLPATIVYAIQFSIPVGDPTKDASEWSSDPAWTSYLVYYHIRKIVEEICFSNYACYCVIYYVTSGYFRDEVHKLWCCTRCSLCKQDFEEEKARKTQYSYVTDCKNKNALPADV